MKKTKKPIKLKLTKETLKPVADPNLADVQGGMSAGCTVGGGCGDPSYRQSCSCYYC